MNRLLIFGLSLPAFFAPLASAQMTTEQRLIDFQHLVGIFAQNYGPYEFKRDVIGFDLYKVQPWVDRIRAAKTDIEYYEIQAEYVASLKDTHTSLSNGSTFLASIDLDADIYDGKALIDVINRASFPAARYPFQLGDEIVTLDGKPVEFWLTELTRGIQFANERATRRLAASFLFFRPQSVIPRAPEVGGTLLLEVRRAATGNLETYEIPWDKTGLAKDTIGPVPSPNARVQPVASDEAPKLNHYGLPLGTAPLLEALQNKKWNLAERGVVRMRGLGSRNPYFNLPAGFQLRLGSRAADFHFSGIYTSGGKRIGYLRIPHFSPSDEFTALNELASEVNFLNANTDGLVLDITRNTGGGCYAEDAMDFLIPYPYQILGDQIRATRSVLTALETQVASLPPGLPEELVEQFEALLESVRTAYNKNRGLTGVLPGCTLTLDRDTARNRFGDTIAYRKPIIVLVDELSISYADYSAAILQEAGRGPLFGYRTNGAGGSVYSTDAGFYSESSTSVTWTIGARNRYIGTDDYGTTNRLENVGVRPEISFDYMTRDNLMSGGKLFTDAFTAAILAEIGRNQ